MTDTATITDFHFLHEVRDWAVEHFSFDLHRTDYSDEQLAVLPYDLLVTYKNYQRVLNTSGIYTRLYREDKYTQEVVKQALDVFRPLDILGLFPYPHEWGKDEPLPSWPYYLDWSRIINERLDAAETTALFADVYLYETTGE